MGSNLRGGLSLCGCVLVAAVSGITLSFSLFSKALKDMFQLDQIEVACLASAIILGHNILLPAGFFHDRFGPKWSMVPAGIFCCAGWVLVLINTLARDGDPRNHTTHVALLVLALLFAGHGRTYFFLSALATCVVNVPSSMRPLALVVMEVVVGAMPMIFPLIFEGLLEQADILASCIKFFSCMIGISFLGAVTGCAFITKSFKLEHIHCGKKSCFSAGNAGEEGRLLQTLPSSGNDTTKEYSSEDSDKSLTMNNSTTLFDMMVSVDYNLIFWTASVLTAIAVFYDYNLVFLLTAYGHRTDSVVVITIYRLAVISTRIVLTIFIFFLQNKPSFVFILPFLCGILTIIFVLLAMFFSEFLWCIRLAYVILGTCCGIAYVFPPILIISIFGLTNFGRNVGILNSAIPILMLFINMVFSHYYDSHTSKSEELYCYGDRCFLLSHVLTLVLAIFSSFLASLLYFRKVDHWLPSATA